MAARDLMPHVSPSGSPLTSAYPVAAATTILVGEPVVLNAGGELVLAGTNPAAVLGVAAESSVRSGSHLPGGAYANTTFAAGRKVTVYKPTDDALFKTLNFARDGAGTAVTPAQTDLGDQAGFTLVGGVWMLDTGAGNLIAEVEDILDAQGNPIAIAAGQSILFGVATTVVFRFLAR